MVNFAGLSFTGLTRQSILAGNDFRMIVTANAEIIVRANEDKKYGDVVRKGTLTFDGQIPYVLAKLIDRSTSFEKISGSDFIYDVCEFARKQGKSIFLLGGKEDSNALSVKKLEGTYSIRIDGFSPPHSAYPFSDDIEGQIQKKISDFKPDYVFVAFGAIKQEYWIDSHADFLKQLGVKFAVGCGGTFDFVAGKVHRAPALFQKIGLEGLWRLLMEPKLFRLKRLLMSFKIFAYALKGQ